MEGFARQPNGSGSQCNLKSVSNGKGSPRDNPLPHPIPLGPPPTASFPGDREAEREFGEGAGGVCSLFPLGGTSDQRRNPAWAPSYNSTSDRQVRLRAGVGVSSGMRGLWGAEEHGRKLSSGGWGACRGIEGMHSVVSEPIPGVQVPLQLSLKVGLC